MTAVSWLLVMFSYGSYLSFGPEFKSQELCQKAAVVLVQSGNERISYGRVKAPWCVRIEK